MKKKRSIAFILCLAMVISLIPVLPIHALGDTNFDVVNENGAIVESVVLPQYEKVKLTASGVQTDGYQWQILAYNTVWVNISGATEETLELSYAMVASLLNENGAATIRCLSDSGMESKEIAVTVNYNAVPETSAAAAEPVVLSEAEAVVGPVVTPPAETEAPVVETEAPAVVEEPVVAAEPVSAGEEEEVVTEEQTVMTFSAFSEARTLAADGDTATVEDGSDVVLPDNVNIIINYVFAKNGEVAATPYTASIAYGSNFYAVVANPEIVGYLPYDEGNIQSESVEIDLTNVTSDVVYTIRYNPTTVNFKVRYMLQNLDGEGYTEDTTKAKTLTGLTDDLVNANADNKAAIELNIPGFSRQWYDAPAIAADGSTVVDVYYERNFYLMLFDLDDGYGVEPIYARYESPITGVGTPSKPGYSFAGWSLDGVAAALPDTMPAENRTYTALWSANDSAKVTIVIWGENANDESYSYIKTSEIYAAPGSTITFGTEESMDSTLWTYVKSDEITVAADGSSVMNVYFDRTTFTLTFRANNKTVATITDKWGASISDEFGKAPFNTTYNGRAWECTDSNKYGYALQTLDIMPQFDATFTLYAQSTNTLKTIYYYVENVGANVSETSWPNSTTNFTLLKTVQTYFKYATYEEEYHEMEGFHRYSASVAGFKNSQKQFSNNTLYLYYLRDSYTLDFNNGYEITKSETVEYEAELDSFSSYVPDFPTELYEADSREFAGWYLNPECTGEEFVLEGNKMPKSNLVLYAKWIPVTHTVKVYMDDTKDVQLGLTLTVSHGSNVPETSVPATPSNGNMKFVGWFYMDGGVEKAFDFNNMPVNKDLEIYAKWSDETVVTYFIYYRAKDANGDVIVDAYGNPVEIADVTTGSTLTTVTRTFDAKASEELYDGYQEGYFPETKSHTMEFSANGDNTYVFYYKEAAAVPYEVHYVKVDADGKEIGPAITNADGTEYIKYVNDNRKAVVTENFVIVPGYMPDAYQKRLVVSVDGIGNVITFYYVEDNEHAYYLMSHWIQDLDGDGYTEYGTASQAIGNVGTVYSAQPQTIPGFTYVETKTEIVVGTDVVNATSATLTTEGLEIRHYYDRNTVDYTVKYLEKDTEKVLAAQKTGSALFGDTVQEYAAAVAGYTCISANPQTWVIQADDTKNVIIFWYEETQSTITYKVVNPDGSIAADTTVGSVDLNDSNATGKAASTSETIKSLNGTAVGATAEASGKAYKFVGWYDNAACTGDPVTTASYIPTKAANEAWPANVTYYAKFEYNLTKMTITKTLTTTSAKDESFVFTVTGGGLTETMTVIVKVPAGSTSASVTIDGLTVGESVSVVESGFNRDYTQYSSNGTIMLGVSDNTVYFTNQPGNNQWLSESAHEANQFVD